MLYRVTLLLGNMFAHRHETDFNTKVLNLLRTRCLITFRYYGVNVM